MRREPTAKTACPACDGVFSTVLPYHYPSGRPVFRRRRRCAHCKAVYETTESPGRIVPHKVLDVAERDS